MDLPSNQSVPMFLKPEDLSVYTSVKYVDVRDPVSYAEGHLINAVNAHDLFTYFLSASFKNTIDEMKSYFKKRFSELGIDGTEHIVIYEQTMNNQYGASCRAYFIFKYMNHSFVSTLEGGLDALIRFNEGEQLITKETPTMIACDYDVKANSETEYLMASREDVLSMVNSKMPNAWLIDVRDRDEWEGLTSSPCGAELTPRTGRIPHALWIEWHKFYQKDNDQDVFKFISIEQVQCLMNEHGIDRNDTIIVYCFTGSRSSVALMKLKQAGYLNVKNYFASWNEWSRDLRLPVDDKLMNGINLKA